MDDAKFERFMRLHRGLPRQGPGSATSTRRALALVPDLPARPRVVDLGCGPGAHTRDILRAVEESTVVAVDLHSSMLRELEARAEEEGWADRVTIVRGDMASLPPEVHPASFHLVWSEAAAYAIGFDEGLRTWRHLLLPGGFIAVSELAWLVPKADAPEPARAFFETEYPGMREDPDNRTAFEAAGFELSGSFVLPASDWWDDYYGPLLERLPAFEREHADDPVALAVASETRREIDVFREHHPAFGYVFYVGRMR